MQPDEKKNSQDIARGTAANYGGFVFRLGVRIPFLFIAGMLFGETRYGGYIFATALVETIAVAALMGYKRSLFGFLEEARSNEDDRQALAIIRSCWALCFGVAVVVAAMLSLSAEVLGSWMDSPDIVRPTRLMAWTLPLIVSSDLLLAATRYKRKVRYEVLARSIAEPTTLTLSAILFYLLGWVETGLPLAYICALIAACAVSVYGFRQCFPDFFGAGWIGIARLREMTARSAPTAGYDIFRALLANAHIMLMAYFFSEGVVGIYGVAVQFTTLVGKIGLGFESILAPVVAQLTTWGKPKQMAAQIRQVIRWIIIIQFAMVLIFVLYGDLLLGLIGEQFMAGDSILSILVVAVMLQTAFASNDLPIMYRKPQLNFYLVMFLLILNVSLILLLAPLMGPPGVATAMLITFLVNAIAGTLLVHWIFGVWTCSLRVMKPLVALSAGLVIGIYMESVGVSAWFSAPVVLLVYAILSLTVSITQRDRVQIRELLRSDSGSAD